MCERKKGPRDPQSGNRSIDELWKDDKPFAGPNRDLNLNLNDLTRNWLSIATGRKTGQTGKLTRHIQVLAALKPCFLFFLNGGSTGFTMVY